MHHCATCGGTWIEEQTLSEHVGTMSNVPPVKLEWSLATDRQGLPCALCRREMEPLLLFGEPVDRCQAHGVWFDKGELAKVLERSAPQQSLAVSTGETVMDVMAVDAGVEVAALGVEVAASGIEVAAEVGGGVLEAMLEVLGAIFSAIDV